MDGKTVTVRAWDDELGIFREIDNPLGPAVVGPGPEDATFYVSGRKSSESEWRASERVSSARADLPAGPVPAWDTAGLARGSDASEGFEVPSNEPRR